jgi:pimeloyl-ACP methyl ester carboxylesterase
MTTTTHRLNLVDIGPVGLTVADHGAGQPFLLLHGGGGPDTVASFGELFANTHPVRIIALTHPGFGGTTRPEA